MSSGDGRDYRLTPSALQDLDDIWRYSAETWSIEQADEYIDQLVMVFETITSQPTIARERNEFTPPVRIQVHESHLIVYSFLAEQITIFRILGARQDWILILKAADL